ncbi:hypothetical protein MN608_02627 [Microdochium nivale]|nr:hypothetical protein MN608_02627 [Microdochium nivale]
MEALSPTTNSSGIFVAHEFSIRDEPSDGLLSASRRPSVVSVVSSVSDAHKDKDAAMVTTASLPAPHGDALPLCLDGIQRHPDVMEDRLGCLLDQRRNDDSLHSLVEFLRRTPPPHNYMSIPEPQYTDPTQPGNKWKRLSALHKRKQGYAPRLSRPPIIKLPDSAVAAKTTGGHRHIAISIPFQYSHLAPLSSSQYPVFDSMSAEFQRDIDSRLGPMTNMRWDHTGTRLHTIGEDRESMASASVSDPVSPNMVIKQERSLFGNGSSKRLSHATDRTQLLLHPLRDEIPRQSSQSEQRFAGIDHPNAPAQPATLNTVAPPIPERRRPKSMASNLFRPASQPRNEPSASRNVTTKHHRRNLSNTSTVSSNSPNQNSMQIYPPSRKSSRRHGISTTLEVGDSIDNVLSDQPGAHRSSFADSLLSTDSVPNVMNAQSAKAYHFEQIPIVVRPPSRPGLDDIRPYLNGIDSASSRDHNDKVATQVKASREASHTLKISESIEAVERPKSRKDKVKARKARDMEAMKSHRNHNSIASVDDPTLEVVENKVSGQHAQETRATALKPLTHRNTILEPMALTGESRPPEVPPLSPARILRKSPKRSKPSQSNTSTDVSKPGSPVNWDSSSSRRRKERHAERKAHSACRERYLAEARADQKNIADCLSRQELALRYENLKELRTFDMEKRLSQLERNGEVWLRSMVPLMNNLNRLLEEQYSKQQNMRYPLYSPEPVSHQKQQHKPRDPFSPEFQPEPVGNHHTNFRWEENMDRAKAHTGYSLRSVRSHDTPLEAQRPRSVEQTQGVRLRKQQLANSQAWLASPLQQEVHRTLVEQRAKNKLEDEIDALIRARADGFRRPRGASDLSISRVSLRHLRHSSMSSVGSDFVRDPKHRETMAMAGDTPVSVEVFEKSLQQIEPLMQELAASARLEHSDSDSSLDQYDHLDDWDLTAHTDHNLYSVY